MEAQLLSLEEHCTELSTVTNTDLHKAWHLLGLLLTIGRPVNTTELASRCTLFRAAPEFVEYLCSIPNSPLKLTGDLFVILSSVAILAFGRFVVNSNTVTPFLPRIGLAGFRHKRVWEDVDRTYYRKRRRVRSAFDDLRVVKSRAFWQNANEEEANQNALPLLFKIEDVCAKVPICIDMSRRMIAQAGNTSIMAFNSEKPDEAMVTTFLHTNSNAGPSTYELDNAEHGSQGQTYMSVNRKELGCVYTLEGQYSFLNLERLVHVPHAITVEGTMACMPHPEVSIQTSITENPIVLREANMDDKSMIISCPEVEKPMIISLVEAENVIYDCKGIVKSCEDEKVMGGREEEQLSDCGRHKIDVENLQNNTAKITVKGIATLTSPDRKKTTAHVDSHATLSADLLSVDQKQLTKSLSNIKTIQKDALNPTSQALCRRIENSTVGANIEQRHEKSISMKHMLKQNYDQKIAKEKKENSKENREKPTSASHKNQLEPKVLPNFESFIVKEEEGSGGYGIVYRAQRKNDGATLAIKCPHANANRHHVYNELKMLERFGGKNFVIKYEGSFKNGGSDCLVLEHVEHDRPEVLKREIDVFQLQWYGYCLFRALAGLHKQGVVHRDVKPGNFLFSRKVNKGYLIDFNLAMDLQKKYGTTDRSTVGSDTSFDRVPLPRVKSLPPTKSRKLSTTKALESATQEAGKGSKSLVLPKNLKRKTEQMKERTDGSGITSAKDATSNRIHSGERLREPIPCQGRKELISLAQEAMQGPNHELTSVPASKRKRVAAPPGRVDKKVVYFTPMPLHSTGIAVAGAGLPNNKGEGKHKREGPCVGTKGFRAPEVLFRSQYQGPKIDIWSAGVTLLYLITGRTPFVGDPDQNIKEIARLRGSEDLWEVAKLHNRESSFPKDLFDVQSLPSTKLRDWCKLITRRPDFHDVIPRSLFDLVDRCLTVNPRVRISAEEALKHEFFAPCHERLRKQRLIRQGLSLDCANIDVLHRQPQACEGLS